VLITKTTNSWMVFLLLLGGAFLLALLPSVGLPDNDDADADADAENVIYMLYQIRRKQMMMIRIIIISSSFHARDQQLTPRKQTDNAWSCNFLTLVNRPPYHTLLLLSPLILAASSSWVLEPGGIETSKQARLG
jgi:hypothetical protein